jgi:hypothetical protein
MKVFDIGLFGQAPTIDLAVGYSKANTSPILTLFLSRIDDLHQMSGPGSATFPAPRRDLYPADRQDRHPGRL